MAYATAEDVSVRWGRELTAEESQLVGVRLEDVERMIRRKVPDLDDQISYGALYVEDVVQVEADAVLRLARNPDGYQSETDGNYSYTMQKDLATGKLWITDDEWEILGCRPRGWFVLVPYAVVDSSNYAYPTVRRSLWRRDIEEVRQDYRVIDWTRQIW
jgi:hypothetical protein